MEISPDSEDTDDHLEDAQIIKELPGIDRKDLKATHLLKALALEMMKDKCKPSERTNVFRGQSSVKRGGAHFFI